MNTYQRNAILIGVGIALLFLVISLITGNWKFFLFSLAPAFVVTMTTLTANRQKGRA